MILFDIVCAMTPLQKLVSQDMPLREAYRLTKLIDQVNGYLAFYSQELGKLGSDPDQQRRKELEDMEITDMIAEPVRIRMSDNLRLSPSDVRALEPLVEFYEGSEQDGNT